MRSQVILESSGFSLEEFRDVKRCLETLCSIQAGSQPLDRELGIDYNGITGYPLNIAENMLALELIDKVNVYEPRVEVDSVKFQSDADGGLTPHIHFVKREA